METDYREKIRKLLALAESPNEHEARAALLKARELMAQHKLTEAEIADRPPKNVVKVLTDVTCSKRRDPWAVTLAATIGENYCCQSFRSHVKGKQTYTIGFIGFEDDVEICQMVFNYAMDCVRSHNNMIRRRYADQMTQLCDSYGYGFTIGVSEAFRKQQEQNEAGWGLVLVTPPEVVEASKDLKKVKYVPRALNRIVGDQYSQGFHDGITFDPKRRLAEA